MSSRDQAKAHLKKWAHCTYWRKNLWLIACLLTVWFLVTFGIGYFARELSFSFFGWPFSFWVGGQGALILYVCLVAYYAWAMNRLDRSLGPPSSHAAASTPGLRPGDPQPINRVFFEHGSSTREI
jgi:putative solute:sodium symporter small subunit